MPVIAIVNRKGGSGKSTLATHVAAWLSLRGDKVMLGDVDRQQSTVPWMRRRVAQKVGGEPLVGWALDPRNVLRPPAGTRHVVLDTPGGLTGFDLNRVLVYADLVLMPVCDSVFDRESAADCLAELRTHPRVASGRVQVAVVGMRVDSRTHGEQQLRAWAEAQEVEFVGALRVAQAYVRCAEAGLTVFDVAPSKVQPDLAQWQPLLEWLGSTLEGLSGTVSSRPARLMFEPALSRPASLPAERAPGTESGAATAGAASPLRTGVTRRPIDVVRTATPDAAAPEGPALTPLPTWATAPTHRARPPVGFRRLLGWLLPQPALPRAR